MDRIYRVKFAGEQAAFETLQSAIPGLTADYADGGALVSAPDLDLGDDREQWRAALDAFCRRANVILALSDPFIRALHFAGWLEISHEGRTDRYILPDTFHNEPTFFPVSLNASSRGGQPRPLAVRAAELCGRDHRFERAANILAEAGEDLVRLYMVMELIERAHGKCPKKEHRAERLEFFRRLEVREDEWVALHRTARPYRHAEPHEDDGPIVTPRQARVLIQHAMKLWLEREVPL